MKQLHIARHGKSSWDDSNISDIDRPLSERGVNNAYMMAKRLLDKDNIPDLLISSPAVRALSTAVIYMRVLDMPSDSLQINEDIYMGYVDDLIRIIRSIDDKVSNLVIFGHNPTFTVLANRFLIQPIDNIPTAGIVSLTYDIYKWADFEKMAPESDFFDYPKRT